MRDALRRHWFLLGLIAALIIPAVFATELIAVGRARWLRLALVAAVMFVMALPVELEQIRATLLRPASAVWASAINSVLVPLLAWSCAWFLDAVTFAGLVVAAAAPCTLASAAVWTRRAGGHDTVALMVTVITGSLCFLVMPAWLWLILGRTDTQIDARGLMLQLLWIVLVPMALAQLVRRAASVSRWAGAHQASLSFTAQIGILVMVAIGAVRTGLEADHQQTVNWLVVAAIVLTVGGLHVAAFAAGWASSRRLGFSRRDTIAVAFGGSQKTLMIGLGIAIEIGASIIPIIAYHAVQLIIGTWLADRIARHRDPHCSDGGRRV